MIYNIYININYTLFIYLFPLNNLTLLTQATVDIVFL